MSLENNQNSDCRTFAAILFYQEFLPLPVETDKAAHLTFWWSKSAIDYTLYLNIRVEEKLESGYRKLEVTSVDTSSKKENWQAFRADCFKTSKV